LPSCKSASST